MKITNSYEEINELINNNDMALLYFSGENCGVCSVIKSKIENILIKYPNIKSLEIKTENSREIAGQCNIFTIPGIIVYVQKKETIREARYISLDELECKIQRYYNIIY